MDGVHHQDIATLLDQQGIAVRAGHHCAHPLMDTWSERNGSISFGIYSNMDDVKKLVAAIEKAVDMLQGMARFPITLLCALGNDEKHR